jgi:hypothetical protein
MFKRISYPVALVVFGMLLGGFLQPSSTQSYAQAGCQTFKETGKTVCGRFLEYWQKNGGLAQQGLPLSGEFTEVNDLNGKPYIVQYFERAVFEKHPENAAPFDVLLSQLGTFQFKRKYPGGDSSTGQTPPTSVPQPSGGIIGQTVKYALFSTSKGVTQATVTGVKESATISAGSIYPEQKAKGKYILVFVDVVNVGTESTSAFYGAKLKDSQGRTFDGADTAAHRNAAEQFNVDAAQDTLQPDIPSKTVLVFDVATNATDYKLVGNK